MHRVAVTQDLALPVERVYAHLAKHENLAALFGADVLDVRPGPAGRHGEGSVRRMRVKPLPAFEETTTRLVPNELIHYRITAGGILRDHDGNISLQRLGTGSRVHYVIDFRAAVPGLGPVVQRSLERSLRSNLPKLDTRA